MVAKFINNNILYWSSQENGRRSGWLKNGEKVPANFRQEGGNESLFATSSKKPFHGGQKGNMKI
jgi:hypothetical protein